MRRLNVRFTQIGECIESALFAVDTLPRNPPLEPGEFLLLQLVKADAGELGKLDERVEFALIFDHVVEDKDGRMSRQHWPQAGKAWRYILVCGDTVPAIPFSLENIDLQEQYSGQSQCVFIEPGDEAKIRKFFVSEFQLKPPAKALPSRLLLKAIHNYDTVIRLSKERLIQVKEHSRRLNDPWPGDALKELYDHRCQICQHNFQPRYGIPHADTRFLQPLNKGGSFESKNRVVLCPNHNGIISATDANFNQVNLAFEYPNGLCEPLTLQDHLIS